jgi:hypothetical protein
MAYEYCNPRPEESQQTQPSTEKDCVWHDALLHKLLECRFHMVYIKLIWSVLTDRKFYVTVAGDRSAECAVLSQTLFNIFTSDFPTLTLTDLQLAFFVDDSALFSTHAKADVIIGRLQSVLNTVKRY